MKMHIVLSAVFAPGIDLRTFFYIYEHISNLNLNSLNLKYEQQQRVISRKKTWTFQMQLNQLWCRYNQQQFSSMTHGQIYTRVSELREGHEWNPYTFAQHISASRAWRAISVTLARSWSGLTLNGDGPLNDLLYGLSHRESFIIMQTDTPLSPSVINKHHCNLISRH